MIIIGLDLSLTRTGMSIYDEGNHVLTKSITTDNTSPLMTRINTIMSGIWEHLEDTERLYRFFIEDLIVGKTASSGKSVERAQLAGVVKYSFYLSGNMQYTLIHNKTLKKYITGSGNKGEKSVMLHNVAVKTGFVATNDDEADAHALADFGYHYMNPKHPIRKLAKYELEVLKKTAKDNNHHNRLESFDKLLKSC